MIADKIDNFASKSGAKLNFMPEGSKSRMKVVKVKNLWKWEHWTIREGPKWIEAEKFLMEKWEGEVKWAYNYKWQPIDLVRGDYNPKTQKWYWLKKIFEKHPEAIWKIQKLLDTLPEKINTREQIVLEDINSYLVIRLLWDNKPKRWIMTAYEKR